MKKKNFIMYLIIAILAVCGVASIIFCHNKSEKNVINNSEQQLNKVENIKADEQKSDNTMSKNNSTDKLSDSPQNIKSENVRHQKNIDTSSNLFNEIPASAFPLSAIAETAKLPPNIQDTISKIVESRNIYMLQRHKDKILLITDNNENIRHNIEFIEISLSNGHQIHTTLGYNDKIKDSDNDIWEYDDSKLPVRHTKYNQDGDLEFVETWNYDNENPLKYEMKDSNNNVISMRKETLENGTDLRVEHLVYDDKGNTVINVSSTYDGQDLKRFTYYNADDIKDSGSIFSEYSDGQKTKEVVYTSDFKVKNSYTSEYKNGEREEITKWDNNNREVERYIQIDTL